uniref:Uncharacterized protein n=1 Tax=Anguilla anguilla TaxID=7936 RepID=A0A0E9T185_ANGAN
MLYCCGDSWTLAIETTHSLSQLTCVSQN